MKINTLNNYTISNKGLNNKYIKPITKIGTAEKIGLSLDNIIGTKYAGGLKTGELLNSGWHADVYLLQGWENSYVVRMDIDKNPDQILNGKKLKPAIQNVNNVVYEYPKEDTSIRKRVPGTPLHGKFWNKSSSLNKECFFETMQTLSKLPDRTFSQYIDDVIALRNAGYRIDTINPNNFLLDKTKGKFNIIDISNAVFGEFYTNKLYLEDFYPFIDSNRLADLIFYMPKAERKALVKEVHAFLDRMISIAKSKGYLIEVPKPEKDSTDFVPFVYHKDKIVFKIGFP